MAQDTAEQKQKGRVRPPSLAGQYKVYELLAKLHNLTIEEYVHDSMTCVLRGAIDSIEDGEAASVRSGLSTATQARLT